MQNETISQYSITGAKILEELLKFAEGFGSDEHEEDVSDILGDSDEDESTTAKKGTLFSRLDKALAAENASDDEALELVQDLERMLKMFYLEARVKGQLKEFKNDYFVWINAYLLRELTTYFKHLNLSQI